MNVTTAKEALEAALKNIASLPSKKGFEVKYDCGYSNSEYEKLSENDSPECIFGEMTVAVSGVVESIAFECAVGVFDTEEGLTVSDDELAQKIGELRDSVRSFLAEIEDAEKESLGEAFIEVIDREEQKSAEGIPETAPKSNKSFYITAILGALAVVAFFLCFKFFF